MFVWLCAKLAAKKLGLRDRGWHDCYFDREFGGLVTLFHTFCQTRIRIGIKENGISVHYCWKCEEICENDDPPPPKGKEPIPKPKAKNVIPFPSRNAA